MGCDRIRGITFGLIRWDAGVPKKGSIHTPSVDVDTPSPHACWSVVSERVLEDVRTTGPCQRPGMLGQSVKVSSRLPAEPQTG